MTELSAATSITKILVCLHYYFLQFHTPMNWEGQKFNKEKGHIFSVTMSGSSETALGPEQKRPIVHGKELLFALRCQKKGMTH